MLDDPRATLDRFATKLGSLQQAYERNPKSFYVEGGYGTGPPMAEERVRQVEHEFGVVLPQEYRAFLRRFGDTGTGPGNRLFRLNEGLTSNSGKPFPLASPFLGCESSSYQRLPKGEQWEQYGRLPQDWEKIPLDHGVLNICDYGCAMYGALVLNGPFCGKVWFVTGDAAYYGPFGGAEALHDEETGAAGWEPPETPKDYSFFEWYESWLDGQLKRIPVR